jgi:DNA-binding MurR/RpiR family transcriptional regulator
VRAKTLVHHEVEGPRAKSVSELIKNLTPKRQEVIRPVLEHPREYVLLTIRELAAKANSDAATILRIVRNMGFATYREFQRYLHDLSIVLATPFEIMQASLAKPGTTSAQIKGSLTCDMKNLKALSNTLDTFRIKGLAEKLYRARQIVLLGGDMAIALVVFLEYKLTILGFPPLIAVTPGRVAHLIRCANKKDVVIAISFRRGLRQTVDGLARAKARGAYCIGISDTYISPIARLADVCLLCSIESPSFGGSYVAPMALLNALLVGCANYRRSRTLALLKEAEAEQRSGYRWYVGDASTRENV